MKDSDGGIYKKPLWIQGEIEEIKKDERGPMIYIDGKRIQDYDINQTHIKTDDVIKLWSEMRKPPVTWACFYSTRHNHKWCTTAWLCGKFQQLILNPINQIREGWRNGKR
jgi:hypothetical protein